MIDAATLLLFSGACVALALTQDMLLIASRSVSEGGAPVSLRWRAFSSARIATRWRRRWGCRNCSSPCRWPTTR